jgi:hypothetical protein
VDALRIHHRQLFGDVALAGQRQHHGLEGRIQRRMAQHASQRLQVGLVEQRRRIGLQGRQQPAQAQALTGFPAIEGVGVVRQQRQQRGVVQPVVQYHRRGKAAQQRRHRFAGHVDEGPVALGLAQHQ